MQTKKEKQVACKQAVHKYIPYYDHLCDSTEVTSGKGCCTNNWDKVTCKECLSLQPKVTHEFDRRSKVKTTL